MLLLRIFFSLFLLQAQAAFAAIEIPQQMNSADRIEALKILGFGTSSKSLSDPYPLGGYSGVEVSVAAETFDIDKLSQLGATSKQQNSLLYPTFSFGKGVYNNIDAFLHFTPFFERISLSRFGGALRWGFYQSQKLPINFSLMIHGGSSNIDNKIISRSYGYDLLTSFQLNKISFYTGIGQTYLRGTFMGDGDGTNTSGVTDTGNTETERTDNSHLVLGATYVFKNYTLAFQLDQYRETVLSGRLGMRF